MGWKRTKLYGDDDHFRELARGFSLVELMVALAIAGFLGIGVWALMAAQNKTYAQQDSTSQMQQNLRAAVNQISTDLRNAGEGPAWQMTFNLQPLPLTTTWYALYAAPNNTFGQPYSYVANSNQLDIIRCAPQPVPPITLGAAAPAGVTHITLSLGQGAFFAGINANPATTYFIDIGDEGAYESAKVTAVVGDTLTITTNPASSKALQNSYALGTNVSILQWITYGIQVVNGVSQLTRDAHDGNGALPVAYNVTSLQASTAIAPTPNPAPPAPPDGGTVQITLTSSTGGANAIQSQAVNTVHLRNP